MELAIPIAITDTSRTPRMSAMPSSANADGTADIRTNSLVSPSREGIFGHNVDKTRLAEQLPHELIRQI